MAEYLIQDTTLTAIADAIRAKTGGTDPIDPADMATEINCIETGTGNKITTTITPNFSDSIEIDSEESMRLFLEDRNNIGKFVKYAGEDGAYSTGRFYEVIDEYEAFDPDACPAIATEVASGTELSVSIDCVVGDLVVAAFSIRSELISLSEGWTLISTSRSISEINASDTTNQTLSFAYKYAASTTESITVTQQTAARIYINMIAISDAEAVTDMGFQYQDNSSVSDSTKAIFTRPNGRLIIWGVTKSFWNAVTAKSCWEISNDARAIQLGSTTQSRLLLAIDTSSDTEVSFTSKSTNTTDAYLCGSLSVILTPRVSVKDVDETDVPVKDEQEINANPGETFSTVILNKPENLVPENIARDVSIAGVVGTFAPAKIFVKSVSVPYRTDHTYTLSHNLGVVPDIALAYIPSLSTSGYYHSMLTGCSSAFNAKFPNTWPVNMSVFTASGYWRPTTTSVCIDENNSNVPIYNATTSTITFGGRSGLANNDQSIGYGLSNGATYKFILIYGLT